MQSARRILMVTRGLPFHQLGGMEVAAWDLAREWRRLGAEVTILTTGCAALGADSVVEGVRIRCVDAPSGRYSRAWWAESRRAYAAGLGAEADVLFSVSAAAFAIVAQHRGDADRPRFVAQAHGTSWGEILSKWRQRRLLPVLKSAKNVIALPKDLRFRSFDAMVAVGQTVTQDLGRFPSTWVIGPVPVEQIDNGIDDQRFAFSAEARRRVRAQHGIRENEKVVLFAARLHREKGIGVALDAFMAARRDDPTLRLIVAGSGPHEAEFRRVAEELGAACQFLGRIDRDALPGYLSAADLFLFPTQRQEGLPLNVLEALASGLPVVTSARLRDERYPLVTVEDAGGAAAYAAAIRATAPRPTRSTLLPEQFTLRFSARRYLDLFERLRG